MSAMEKVLGAAFGGSALALLIGYVALRTLDARVVALFKFVSDKGVEKFKTDLAKKLQTWQRDTETELKLRALQEPVRQGAVRVFVRLSEVFSGKFQCHYSQEWNPARLD